MEHFREIQFFCFLLCVSSVVLNTVERAPPAPPLDMAMEEDQMRSNSADPCADKVTYCSYWKDWCKTPGYTGYMEKNCMKTCGATRACAKLLARLNLPKCDNSMVKEPKECNKQKETYCKIAEKNTMCLYCGVNEKQCGNKICNLGITDPADIKTIVDKHNQLRRRVAKGLEKKGKEGKRGQPGAANMMEVQWDEELAKMAQTWVNQCSEHAHDANRNVKSGQHCGQNYAWMSSNSQKAKKEGPLKDSVDDWYKEVKDFDSDTIASCSFNKKGTHTGVVGHYTQVIWAKLTKIGCGYIERLVGNMYERTVICNYSPGGNKEGDEIYKVGEAGSDCPPGSQNVDGLCRQN